MHIFKCVSDAYLEKHIIICVSSAYLQKHVLMHITKCACTTYL